MPIRIVCPSCQARMKAPDAMAGRKTKCPKCGGPIMVTAEEKPSVPREKAATEAERGVVPRSPKPAAAAGAERRRDQSDDAAVKRRPHETPAAAKSRRAAEDKDYDDLEIVRPGAGTAREGPATTWATSALGQRERLLVTRGSVFQLSSLIYRDFNILDPETKQPIGVASDNPGTLVQCLRCLSFGRFSLRNLLPTNLEVREDEKGPLLFRIRRAPQWLKFFVTVEIYDGTGHLLGYFKNKIFALFGGFWVYDADDNKVAELKFQMGLPPKMMFVTAEGEALGSVYPEGARKAIEQGKVSTVVTLGRAPGLDLKISERMKDDPAARLLMLAAVLAMQFSGIGGKFRMKA
jgi:hypothetical protein